MAKTLLHVSIPPKGMGVNDFMALQGSFLADEGVDTEAGWKTPGGTPSKSVECLRRPQGNFHKLEALKEVPTACKRPTVAPDNFRDNTVRALENGLRAIESFESDGRRLTLSQVAERVGLTRATARRSLHTLCALGYAEHDGKYFWLTPRVLKLGYAFISTTPLANLAQPFLEQLGARTGEVVALGVLDETEVVFLTRSSPRHNLVSFIGIGARLPAFHSSSGRILLATKPDKQIERLLRKAVPPKRLTVRSKTNPQDILREITLARSAGYAIDNEESEIGVRMLAVPVLTSKGTAVAAISISSRCSDMSLNRMVKEALPLMQGVSRALGDLL